MMDNNMKNVYINMSSDTSSLTTTASGPWNNNLLLAEFRESVRLEHNRHRADHGSAPLQLNNKLNVYAQYWANMCAEMEHAVHRPHPDYDVGESVQANWWPDNTSVGKIAAEICKDFYSECLLYDFHKGGYSAGTAHFTQLVWYDTTELGVGIAIGESERVYCVVNYTPQGNTSGGYRTNVLAIGTKYKPRPKLIDESVFVPPPVAHLDGDDEHMRHFRMLLTNQHNIYRKHHNVPFLQNSEYLNGLAQQWAESCAEHGETVPSNNGYGENVYVSDYYPSALEICKAFKADEVNYRFDENTNRAAQRFTQMVWKSSKEIGIGMKKAENGKVYVVCVYNPRGNISGEYTNNVFHFVALKSGPVKVHIDPK